jgi:hypothetical protein
MGNRHSLARKIKNATVAGETMSLLPANLRMRNVIVQKQRPHCEEIARKDEKREQKSANYFLKHKEGAYEMYHVTGDKSKAITIDMDTNNGT